MMTFFTMVLINDVGAAQQNSAAVKGEPWHEMWQSNLPALLNVGRIDDR